MHQHGPDQLIGPLRGSSAWWRGLAASPAIPGEGPQVKTRKKRSKKDDGIRKDLVARVRKEIDAGTYDTPEKWEQALDRLLDRLDGD